MLIRMKPAKMSLLMASSIAVAMCGCAAPNKDLAHRQKAKNLPQLVRFFSFTKVRRTPGALFIMGGGSAAADGGKYSVTPRSSFSSQPLIELTLESSDSGALDSCQRQVEAARQNHQPIDIRGLGHFSVRSMIDPPLDTNLFTLTQLDACGSEVSGAAVSAPALSSATLPSPDHRTIKAFLPDAEGSKIVSITKADEWDTSGITVLTEAVAVKETGPKETVVRFGEVYAFSPTFIAVHRDEPMTLHFRNLQPDDEHDVAILDKKGKVLTEIILPPVQETSYVFTFHEEGLFPFQCTIHQPGMSGQILVLPPEDPS
jgi:plastocyanin